MSEYPSSSISTLVCCWDIKQPTTNNNIKHQARSLLCYSCILRGYLVNCSYVPGMNEKHAQHTGKRRKRKGHRMRWQSGRGETGEGGWCTPMGEDSLEGCGITDSRTTQYLVGLRTRRRERKPHGEQCFQNDAPDCCQSSSVSTATGPAGGSNAEPRKSLDSCWGPMTGHGHWHVTAFCKLWARLWGHLTPRLLSFRNFTP